MFLLNSQDPLVTATCGSTGIPQNRRHPFFRRYGANLPSSLTGEGAGKNQFKTLGEVDV